MDFSQVPCLAFLDLSENRLASIHGLGNCPGLLELILDENRIARLGMFCVYYDLLKIMQTLCIQTSVCLFICVDLNML